MTKILIELPSDLVEGIKILAKKEGRSMNKQLLYDLTRMEKYLKNIPNEINKNTIQPDTLTKINTSGQYSYMEPTDIKAPIKSVNNFFLKKDEKGQDVFDYDYFNVEGMQRLLNENQETRIAYYKAVKDRTKELECMHLVDEAVKEMLSSPESSEIKCIIDELLKNIK